MLAVIEKLLILQDRDRKLLRAEAELASVGPERAALESKIKQAQSQLESTKLKARQIESDRKKLELDVEAKEAQIAKYSNQQLQTKKNDEYRALANEIENCRKAIAGIEDQELELMEQADAAAKELAEIAKTTAAHVKDFEAAKVGLADKEVRLKKELADLRADYDRLQSDVDEEVRDRYVRLRKLKGATTVVGIEHSVCGGCHMKLPIQIVVSCKGDQEIVNCPNCGRILYFTREMNLDFVD